MSREEELRSHAEAIIDCCLEASSPGKLMLKALASLSVEKKYKLVSLGKAAWTMADTVHKILKDSIVSGLVVTKYGHSRGSIADFEILEAGHPLLDERSFVAGELLLDFISDIKSDEELLICISGGASSLVESSDLSLAELRMINENLLKSGADILEINTIRKRLSKIKGGKLFDSKGLKAKALILSDVIDNDLSIIASGLTVNDESTAAEACKILDKYGITVSKEAIELMQKAAPAIQADIENMIVGSAQTLLEAAIKAARSLGYHVEVVGAAVSGEARKLGQQLGKLASRAVKSKKGKLCYLVAGETTVTVSGNGLGGRNQEIALAAMAEISGLEDCLIFALASDGTDGPTDAAGGMVTGSSLKLLELAGLNYNNSLLKNDSYHALKAISSLIFTGPTGTNVNDIAAVLILNKP